MTSLDTMAPRRAELEAIAETVVANPARMLKRDRALCAKALGIMAETMEAPATVRTGQVAFDAILRALSVHAPGLEPTRCAAIATDAVVSMIIKNILPH